MTSATRRCPPGSAASTGSKSSACPNRSPHWDCRNNRLAWLGLQADGFIEAVAAARERYGAVTHRADPGHLDRPASARPSWPTRSSTPRAPSPPTSAAPQVHTPHSLAMFVQQVLGLSGPSETISTACSSSAKVFASAERLIRLGLADAAVVGGVDTLCGSVLFGFNSLELVSSEPCRPFDATRNGISLGEAAGFALVERVQTGADAAPLHLLGYGEASDAHHMSTPHPEGLGAERALDEALARAGLAPEAIDYINMHGTASTEERRGRRRAGGAPLPGTHARQLDQGLHGPHAGRGRASSRPSSACWRIETRPDAGHRQHHARSTPSCGPQIKLRTGARRGALCADQLLRLRRQQLLAGVRQGGRSDMNQPPTRPPTLYIEGPAFWTPTLPGWEVARAAFRGDGAPADPPAKRAVAAGAGTGRAPPRARHRGAGARGGSRRRGRPRAATRPTCPACSPRRTATWRSTTTCAARSRATRRCCRRPSSTTRCTTPRWATGPSAPAAWRPATRVAAYEHSFASGLLEAAAQCAGRPASRCCWWATTCRRWAR